MLGVAMGDLRELRGNEGSVCCHLLVVVALKSASETVSNYIECIVNRSWPCYFTQQWVLMLYERD